MHSLCISASLPEKTQTKDIIVTPLGGFWVMVTETALDPALLNHPNVQIVKDRTAQLAGAPSVVLANIDTAHIGIVANGLNNYVADGLQ